MNDVSLNADKEARITQVRTFMHDLHNLFTIIQGNVSLAESKLKGQAEVAAYLEAAEKATHQARLIAQHLASLQTGEADMQIADLKALVEDCTLVCLGASKIESTITAEDHLPSAAMQRASAVRIINNLLINAKEAMPNGGSVSLRVFLSENTEQDAKIDSECTKAASKYVCIEVQDTGEGVAPEDVERIFKMHFTNKLWGQGLGLASSLAIARSFGGDLKLVSDSDQKGACFKLFIPIGNSFD